MSRQGKERFAVSLVVALFLMIPLGLRWQAQWSLHSYRKKLIAAGEKLTVEELAPKINAQATNTARFLKLASALPLLRNYYPAAMRRIKPGVACVVWRQARCMEQIDINKPAVDIWPVFSNAMRTDEQVSSELQALMEEGGIQFSQDYSSADSTVSGRPSAERVGEHFSARAMLALHEGNMQEAFQFLKDSGTASQLASEVPLETAQLFHFAYMHIEVAVCWEALQASGWTDEQLAELQHQWDQPTMLMAAVSCLAMERARMPMYLQMARASRQDMIGMGVYDVFDIWDDFLLHPIKGINELLSSYPRYYSWRWIWSYRDEQLYLQSMQTVIEAARNAQNRHVVAPLLKKLEAGAGIDSAHPRYFDMCEVTFRLSEGFVRLALREQTVANMVATAIALERYRLVHQAYPASLADLVPANVKAIPIDWMDGRDLRYRLKPDGTYLLYSVGDDGVDNGGDPTPETGKSLSFYNGRDLVWPRPATEEEVQAYDAEHSKPTKRK